MSLIKRLIKSRSYWGVQIWVELTRIRTWKWIKTLDKKSCIRIILSSKSGFESDRGKTTRIRIPRYNLTLVNKYWKKSSILECLNLDFNRTRIRPFSKYGSWSATLVKLLPVLVRQTVQTWWSLSIYCEYFCYLSTAKINSAR